jgi:serine/threonine protein kinase
MGEVYEARQLNPPRPVALKVLAPWLANDEEALERFWREAAVPAQLDHPGIVHIISMGKTAEGIAYYVMNLIRGISLSDLLRLCQGPQTDANDVPTAPDGSARTGKPSAVMLAREAPPSVLAEYRGDRFLFAARYGAIAARALAHAHQQGFLHRDVKPSNLMIDHHGQLYMVDFGLTRALDPDATSTRYGQIRGTPWYMSPEQARGEPLDERSDIYSLGVTLYELITEGEGPFTASRKNAEAVLAQVRTGMILPLQTLAPDVPRQLERVIHRAIDFRPERRYRSAAALAEDLEEAVRHSSSAPTLTQTKQRRTGPRWFASRHWLRAAALLVLALLGAAFVRFGPNLDISGPPSDPPGQIADPPREPLTAASLEEKFKRDRPFGVRTPLIRDDSQPVRAEILWGKGHYVAAGGKEMVVYSPWDNNPTVIALDYLPRGSFEFSIEIRQDETKPMNTNDLGVVFGWRTVAPDPQAIRRFFNVQIDERPGLNCSYGRVTIGTGQRTEREGARGAISQLLAPLPNGRGILALGKPPNGPRWHKLVVAARQGKIRITVDGDLYEEFDVERLQDADSRLNNVSLDAGGAMGIWVRNGQGYFRNAFIKPLP